ncbi:MAG: LytTR family DNA-binding domain-containing protein [Proteobacteria bacterium]|jgi:two-component system, LytTR family, response regulator AlgR|nr:LytTR family DNA-binding domain-containing protein [Pseudomonadota bacterium]
MKILIVDDEQPARTRLRGMLQQMENCEVVAEAANGRHALEASQQYQPDVVLLDIRMPGMDGLEAAEHLGKLEVPPAVIFTTAYDDYALSAFKTHAVDYLLKPVRREHLQLALNAARRLNRPQLQAIVETETQTTSPTHISARVKGDLVLIEVGDIFYLQAEHKYVTVGYRGGEVLIEDSLVTLEKKFARLFMRVHRNALVAKQYITALEKNASGHCQVRLNGCDKVIEVSRRHLPEVRKFMKR